MSRWLGAPALDLPLAVLAWGLGFVWMGRGGSWTILGWLSGAAALRLIAFDWDGTLADSTALITEAIQRACGDLGLPVPDTAVARHVIGLGMHDSIAHVAPSLAVTEVCHLLADPQRRGRAGPGRGVLCCDRRRRVAGDQCDSP